LFITSVDIAKFQKQFLEGVLLGKNQSKADGTGNQPTIKSTEEHKENHQTTGNQFRRESLGNHHHDKSKENLTENELKGEAFTGSLNKEDAFTGNQSKDDSIPGNQNKDDSLVETQNKNDFLPENQNEDDSLPGNVEMAGMNQNKDDSLVENQNESDSLPGNQNKDNSQTDNENMKNKEGNLTGKERKEDCLGKQSTADAEQSKEQSMNDGLSAETDALLQETQTLVVEQTSKNTPEDSEIAEERTGEISVGQNTKVIVTEEQASKASSETSTNADENLRRCDNAVSTVCGKPLGNSPALETAKEIGSPPIDQMVIELKGKVTMSLDELDNQSGVLHVFFLIFEGLASAVSSCPKNYQPQTLEALFQLMRSAANVPGEEKSSVKLYLNVMVATIIIIIMINIFKSLG